MRTSCLLRLLPLLWGGLLVLGGSGSAENPDENDPLLCFVGGTMRPAMEKLVEMYKAKTGIPVLLDYADSGELFIRAEQTRRGDLLVVHDPYLAVAVNKGLADQGYTVAGLTGVIVVAKGNPKKIQGFTDLAKPGIRLIFTDPIYSTLGHIVELMCEKTELYDKIMANCVTRTKTGGEAANAVGLGTVDAAIVWNAVAFLRRDKLDAIPIESRFQPQPGVDTVTTATFGLIDMSRVRVTAITLSFSKQIEKARAFAAFLASEEAVPVWKDRGYTSLETSLDYDKSVSLPQDLKGTLFLYCGAGMRLPIEKLVKEFEAKTQVQIQASYDGSNKLLGQMELTKKGDVFVAGDADYVEMARKKGWISKAVPICFFQPVILVQKGNPKGIQNLSDLLRPKMRVGQGDPKVAAVGRILPRLFELHGIDPGAWSENVMLNTATVNELGVAVKLRTLDAAVVWDAIAAAYAKDTEAISIDKARNVFPVVEAAVLTFSENPQAADALIAYLASARAQQVLTSTGYSVGNP